MMVRFAFMAVLALVAPACGCGGGEGAPTTATAGIMVHWSPQAQFAGYYVAQDRGFYLRRGAEVQVLRGGPNHDPIEALVSGEAQFATTFLTAALVQRDRGVPLVHLAQVVNRSSQMVIAWRSAGVTSVRDLDGRRVSVWEGGFRPAYEGFFKSQGVAPRIVPQYYSINLFLHRGVAACTAMYFNEFHMLYQAGVDESELTLFFMRDYGFGSPEDGIYCLEETFRRNPELCRAVVDGSLEGWTYAAAHTSEALAAVMKRVREAHVPTNQPHMRWMLEKIVPAIVPDAGAAWKLGELDAAEYAKTASLLKNNGLITAPVPFEVFRGGSARP